MFKTRQKEEMCKIGEALMEDGMYDIAMRHFALVFSNGQNYARAALGIAEVSLKMLENSISSLNLIDDVAGRKPFMKRLIESDKKVFTENAEKESESAVTYFRTVKKLVKEKRDTSDLLRHRPKVLNECSKGIDRVSELNDLFL